jgi:dihydrofolate synthase/folylpolyglutamate synthase
MFSRTGSVAYKKDITNTVLLCDFIGNPQNKIKTIHIAGTNGKGSTSHMLAAVLQQCGYKTGLYTSPHLKDFRERIKINRQIIPEDFIVSFVNNIKSFSEQIKPSFFELTVAMMLDYFAKQKVDITIVETGLGGRSDSTNIITPELSIITNIGYDHMNILGNTLEEIALEKAGIIKKNIPVVIGETLPQTKNIFLLTAQQQESPIFFAEEQFSISNTKLDIENLYVTLKDPDANEGKNYALDLNGIYQQNNLRTVITALSILGRIGYSLNDDNIHYALTHVKEINGLYGRWNVIERDPIVVLDVAHNEDGIRQLLAQLSLYSFNQLHIVFGIVKDKEISKILSLLPKNAIYYFTSAQILRALPGDELSAKAKEFNLNGDPFPEVNVALAAAKNNAGKNDMILVCGSVYLIGEVNTNYENISRSKSTAL